MHPELDCVASSHDEVGVGGPVVQGELHWAREREASGTSLGDDAGRRQREERLGAAVLHPRGEGGRHPDRSLQALDSADEQVWDAQTDVVPARVGCERGDVGEGHLAVRGAEDCAEHERPVFVGARRLEVGAGPDRPVAGVRVEEAGEHRRCVEACGAPPVDRAGAVDERGRLAVGQEAVVGNRRLPTRRAATASRIFT